MLAALIRFVVPILIFISGTITAFAQHAKQYSFKHFSVSNGLASNTVSMTIQDAEGYIWLATTNGLQRYDGNSFITFKTEENNPASIPSTHLYRLFVDRKKNLWVLGDNFKVGIFDTRKFLFREARIIDKKPMYGIIKFMEMHTGELVLVADGLVYKYIEKDNHFIPAAGYFSLPPKWHLNSIHWDHTRRKYWIACDSGLVQFDPFTKHVNYRNHNIDKDPIIEVFKDQLYPERVFTDAKNNLIFGHWPPYTGAPVVFKYDEVSKKKTKYSLVSVLGVYHELTSYLQQRNGRLWIYGMPFFMEWTDEEQPFHPLTGENLDEPRIKYDNAFHAFEDRENNIWISTDNGVYLFNPDGQIFNTYGLLRPGDKAAYERPVTSVAQLRDGKIFVGTWGSSGLYCFDNAIRPLPLPSAFGEKGKGYTVWDMAINGKTNELWITLQDGGIVVYNQKQNKVTEVYPDAFGKSTIRQIDDDTSGNMWFGTQNGTVVKWDYKKSGNDPSKGYEVVFKSALVHKVHFDYHGFIWVATLQNGLYKIDVQTNKIVKHFTTEGPPGERIFKNSPTDMTYYDDSTLIVTAGCINVINTKTNKIRFISTADGLPSNTAESVERDEKGILWVGMTNGICRVNLKKNLISFYDRRDGIAYDKFNTAGVHELRDGRIIFLTDHNFLVFNPAAFGQKDRPSQPYITSFMLSGKPLSMDSLNKAERVVLSYDNTSIGITFSALSYLQQTKLHYYYMLENLDAEWIHTDKPLEAIYNHLPPGSYTFKVKTENTDGITSKMIAAIDIVVRPPFWNTWWFYGLVLLLLITILYVIDKERINKRNSLRQMRSQIAGNLHTEISNTLNNINVLSEIAKIKADKNIEQSKEFIGQISNKSRYMMEAMDDILWSIDPQNDSMKKTLYRIRELTDGLRVSYDVDIDLIVDNKVQALELDMKLRHELFFFYKEALMYLLDHAKCSQVFVNINQVKSKMLIEIISECKYITDEFKSRFKKSIQKRTEALSASVDITSDNRSFSLILYVDLK